MRRVRFFLKYLRQRRGLFLLFLLFVLFFLCFFLLYRLPVGAVLYPTMVCAVFGILFCVVDVRRAWNRHKKCLVLRLMPCPLREDLPPARTLEDEDYQEIIKALQQEQKQLQNDMDIRYQDMVDYYTTWVHQIKTPIASARLVLQSEDTSVSRQLSEEIQRIEQYVEMVLAFVRLGSDTRDFVFYEQELDAIVKEAVKKFSGQFIRKKLQLRYAPLHVRVLTDEKWLAFVIEQILSNALKYTQTGSITIDLEEPLTLCIRDTGIGIAPEDLPRVFEKSYTGYHGRSDKKASGIGLYLCRRICDSLGHDISINSSPGSGTVVRIRLERKSLHAE